MWIDIDKELPEENLVVEGKLKDGTIVWAHRYAASWFISHKNAKGRKKWHLDLKDEVIEWRKIEPPKEQ